MKCSAIWLECSYIMDFMVFQADFDIYYGIIVGTAWYRGGFITNGIVFILGVFRSNEFTPYRHIPI